MDHAIVAPNKKSAASKVRSIIKKMNGGGGKTKVKATPMIATLKTKKKTNGKRQELQKRQSTRASLRNTSSTSSSTTDDITDDDYTDVNNVATPMAVETVVITEEGDAAIDDVDDDGDDDSNITSSSVMEDGDSPERGPSPSLDGVDYQAMYTSLMERLEQKENECRRWRERFEESEAAVTEAENKSRQVVEVKVEVEKDSPELIARVAALEVSKH